jgi:REP element-mobilizing transposase RayT
MVRWYHLIISAYGFWLPNDPRGSWSDFVGAWELLKFGGPTKVEGKRSYAHDPNDRAFRLEAKKTLKYPPVRFDGAQRAAVGEGFGRAIGESAYPVHACCIGYDHAHLVIGRHVRTIEQIAIHLKSKASMALRAADCHRPARYANSGSIPTPWAEGCWSVFIQDRAQLGAAIDYVARHPVKEGLPAQAWSFVGEPPSDFV